MTKHLNDLEQTLASSSGERERTLTVYLAGGFHSGWQDVVKKRIQRFAFLDPREHGLRDPTQYTLWDLEAIRRSDLVFAYLESTNPAGYSLAFEVGFAKALGKRIILVDERSALDERTKRYMGMVQASADVLLESLDEGVNLMTQLERVVCTG
jgi:nucleoside 2-deoxyribosyltransferase